MEQLRGVVPFVERLAQLEAVVALQAQQGALQGDRQRLGQLGLADAGFAFQQQRALQPQGQEDGGGEAAVGEVAGGLQAGLQGVDGGEGAVHMVRLWKGGGVAVANPPYRTPVNA